MAVCCKVKPGIKCQKRLTLPEAFQWYMAERWHLAVGGDEESGLQCQPEACRRPPGRPQAVDRRHREVKGLRDGLFQ